MRHVRSDLRKIHDRGIDRRIETLVWKITPFFKGLRAVIRYHSIQHAAVGIAWPVAVAEPIKPIFLALSIARWRKS